MKADEATRNTTVVVLSTSSSTEDIAKAKQLGAAGYFVKPYSLKGYEDIKAKIMENLGLNSLSFTNVVENFLRTFQLLLRPKSSSPDCRDHTDSDTGKSKVKEAPSPFTPLAEMEP